MPHVLTLRRTLLNTFSEPVNAGCGHDAPPISHLPQLVVLSILQGNYIDIKAKEKRILLSFKLN